MARRIRTARYLNDIGTARALREARRDIDTRLWYAEDRFVERTASTFSVDNLISLIAPPGSLTDRLVGGVSSGLATIRGIMSYIRYRNNR